MSRIDPSLRLAALLRQQLKPLAKPGRAQGDSRTRARAGDSPVSDPLARISSLEATDPDRRRKAVRIYLESILLSELGQELLSDPEFPEIVNRIQAQLEADPELARACSAAADVLLARSSGDANA